MRAREFAANEGDDPLFSSSTLDRSESDEARALCTFAKGRPNWLKLRN
jgi:hypothetical protein